MVMYVVLTAYLFQKGSSESKPLGKTAPQEQDPRTAAKGPKTPWPVRRGGWVLKIYEHSLSGLFLLLFAASTILHVFGGATAYSEEQLSHGQPVVTGWEYVGVPVLV